MNCLIDYIGIKGCGNTAPPSGLYVNELAGISLESIAKVAKPEQATYLEVWADVQKRATRKFATKVTAYFSTRYRLKKLLDNLRIGRNEDITQTILPAPASKRGIVIELDERYGDGNYSQLSVIHVSDLEFFASAPATLTFSIGSVGREYIFTRDVVAGWNTILNEYTIPVSDMAAELRVAVLADTVATIYTDIPERDYVLPYGLNCACACVLDQCCSALVRGFTDDGVTTSYTADNAHGFRMGLALRCSFDGLVCANRDLFSTSLWFLLGVELMAERMFTDRINRWTTIDREKAKNLHAYYLDAFDEEIGLVIDGIDMADFGCCLECDPLISFKETQL